MLRPALVSLFVTTFALAGCGVAPIPDQGGDRLTVPGGGADLRPRARAFVAVVAAVEPVAEAECRAQSPLRNCDFRIVVDDRPGMPPNAYQTVDDLGRPVVIFTLGLIATVENDDELAFVLGHETAHHIAGHLERAQANAQIGAAVLGQIAARVNGGDPQAIRTAQEIGAAVGARSYSREFELEADALGTVIAARAGYDPLRGALFFNRIPDPGNRFLGTHPPNAERMAVVQAAAAALGL